MPLETSTNSSEQDNKIEIRTTREGFNINGKNPTSLILSLTSLNGTPIKELEARMRPGNFSRAGFLGDNESLIKVLADDNDKVLGMGLTHQQLADLLNKITNAPENAYFKINGKQFSYTVQRWKNPQESPFKDGTGTYEDYTVVRSRPWKRITFSGLLVEMIRLYGFYEGIETTHRLDPEDLATFLGLIPPAAA